MREKKKKVLMIGPSLKVQGGISAVAQKYFDNGICNYANIKYIATTVDSNKFVKAIFALFALLRVIILGPFYEVMHVHLASRNSFHRKFFFINYFFFLKKKVVVHLHGGEFDKFFLEECNERIKSRIRKVFLKSDKTIVLSKEWRKKLINIIGIEVDEKIIILPNAVNIPRYIPKNYKNNSMIFLGRLVPEKGLLEIFQGVAQIKEKYKDFSVTICGGGDIDKYIKICEELSKISFLLFI